MVNGKVVDHRQGGASFGKPVKDQPHGLLHFLVGVQNDALVGIEDEPDGQPEAQLAVAGLLQLAAQQPAAQPMQFGLAHRAPESQQQAIVVLVGIVEAVFVDDQGLGQRADLQEPIPIAAGAGQARGFQAQDRPGPAHAHFGEQLLEAIAADRRGARAPLVLVEDGDAFLRPTQSAGALDEMVLARGAGGMRANLEQGGLAHVNERLAVEMFGAEFSRRWAGHDRSPQGGRRQGEGEFDGQLSDQLDGSVLALDG